MAKKSFGDTEGVLDIKKRKLKDLVQNIKKILIAEDVTSDAKITITTKMIEAYEETLEP